jgi:hypothetical protein
MLSYFTKNYSDSGKIVAISDRYMTESEEGDMIPLDEMNGRRNEKSDFVNEGFTK